MAIYTLCPQCKSSSPIGSKSCPRCGLTFTGQSKRYRVHVIVRGKTVVRTAQNLAVAREMEAAIKADILREKYDVLQRHVPSLDEVWRRYLPYAQEVKKSWKTDFLNYNTHIKPRLGSKPLDKISPLDIERLISEMKKSKNRLGKPFKPATIKHQVVIIRRLFNLAAKWGMWEGSNPVKKVAIPKVDNLIIRYLTTEETARLLNVLSWWPCRQSAALIKLALFTGMRKGELLKLKWSDIDLERRLLTIHDPKGGRSATLPMAPEAAAVLAELPRNGEHVFTGPSPGPKRTFKNPWLRVRKAAGLPANFRFHDLRHHFASTLVSSGTDLAVVSALLVHKDLRTTQRYAHLQPGALREAVDRIGTLVSAVPETERGDLKNA